MTNFTGADWRKSSASTDSGNCVEYARVGVTIGVRDSKDLNGPILQFSTGEWATFCAGMRAGNFQ